MEKETYSHFHWKERQILCFFEMPGLNETWLNAFRFVPKLFYDFMLRGRSRISGKGVHI